MEQCADPSSETVVGRPYVHCTFRIGHLHPASPKRGNLRRTIASSANLGQVHRATPDLAATLWRPFDLLTLATGSAYPRWYD